MTRTKVIEKLAYNKWQKAGMPLGKDNQFWQEAEREAEHLHRVAERMLTAIRHAEEQEIHFPSLDSYSTDCAANMLLFTIAKFL